MKNTGKVGEKSEICQSKKVGTMMLSMDNQDRLSSLFCHEVITLAGADRRLNVYLSYIMIKM